MIFKRLIHLIKPPLCQMPLYVKQVVCVVNPCSECRRNNYLTYYTLTNKGQSKLHLPKKEIVFK